MNDRDLLNKITYVDNVNQTLRDPFLYDISKVTLNSDYYPRRSIIGKRSGGFDYYKQLISFMGYCYFTCFIKIYHGDNFTCEIPILFQREFSESNGASYIKESPVGSNKPIIAFSNKEPSTLNFTFVAIKDYLPDGYTSLKSYIDDLKLMTTPKYSGNIVLSPSVKLLFQDCSYECVCDSIGVNYNSTLLDNRSFVYAEISCSFTVKGSA